MFIHLYPHFNKGNYSLFCYNEFVAMKDNVHIPESFSHIYIYIYALAEIPVYIRSRHGLQLVVITVKTIPF